MTLATILPARYIAWLTLTRGCQLRCNWCYAKDTGFGTKMSDETLAKTIGLINDLSVTDVCLIGGEPTIDPRFLQTVSLLRRSGHHVSVVSNGLKFSKNEFIEETIDAGINSITVSLKGFNREDYCISTQRDAFGSVMKSLRNLANFSSHCGLKFNLLITLCSSMVENINHVINTIIESGVKKVTFDTERPIVCNGKVEYGGLTPQEMANFLAQSYGIMQKLLDYGIEYCVYVTHPHCIFPKGYLEGLEVDGRLASGCQIQRGNGIIIDEKGKILPCNHFCNSGLSSVDVCKTSNDYFEMRKSEQVIKFYAKVNDYPARKCIDCSRWEKCGAGCRINWFKFSEEEMLPSQ